MLSFLTIVSLLMGNLTGSVNIFKTEENYSTSPIKIYENGWLEEQYGIKIVHLKGSFYDMGYQYGSLLKYEILKGLRAQKTLLPIFGVTYTEIQEDFWNNQKNYMSEETLDYIQGTADALGINIDDYGWVWLLEGVAYFKLPSPTFDYCSSFAAWGNATSSGELIQVRMIDGPPKCKDPVTGEPFESNPILVVADPDDGNAFAYPTFAGYCAEDGFNEMGISVMSMWSRNNGYKTVHGAPIGTRILETLYTASDIETALSIMTTNKTYGYMMIISDSKIPLSYAVETTGNLTYFGTWDNTIESTYPFWEIDHVVRRINCLYINETFAATQRENYNPKSIRYIISNFPGLRKILGVPEDFGVYSRYCRYQSTSIGIQQNWGKIDLKNAMEIAKKMYLGGYFLPWKLLCIKLKSFETWWIWAVSGKTGDLLISYMTPENPAYKNPSYQFNLFELLESQP